MAAQAVGHALVRAGHGVEGVVVRRGVALRARRVGRNVIRGLGVAGLVAGKRRRRAMATAAIAGGGMELIERRRARVSCRACGAGDHPHIGSGLVAGGAGGHLSHHRRVSGDAQGGCCDARRTDLEATRRHLGRAVTARAVAIQVADRNVIGPRRAHDGDIGESVGHRRRVAAQAVGHALVRAGHRVERRNCRRWCDIESRSRWSGCGWRASRPWTHPN